MKEYICKKDFYIEDIKFASAGDYLGVMNDGRVVRNINTNKVIVNLPEVTTDKEHFVPAFKTSSSAARVNDDKVNHPPHYTWLEDKCGIEVIDITRHMDFDLGNAIKYILRAGHKEEEGYTNNEKEIEDLQKAVWYINDRINQLKNGNKNN